MHAVLAKEGIVVGVSDLFGTAGRKLLAGFDLAPAYRWRVESLLALIDHFDRDIDRLCALVDDQLAADPGYTTIQTIPGVGPVLAAVFVAEIGDVHRFARPQNLCSWAGLTPRHYESDTTVRRGHITKQGSRLVRWAAVEAVQRLPATTQLRHHRDHIAARRGRGIGKVAAARKLLTLVYYGLRDHHIRCLEREAA